MSQKALLSLTLVSMIANSVASSLLPFYAKKIIDGFISSRQLSVVLTSGIILVVLSLLNFGLRLVQIYYGNLAGQRIMKDIRLDFFMKLLRFKIETYNREPAGKIITRITNDVENMNELLNSGVVALISDLLLVVFAIVFLFLINAKLALISIIPLPLAVVLAVVFGNRMERAYEKVRDALTKINIHMQESLSGLPIVQIFQNEERNFGKFDEHAKEFRFSFNKTQMLNVLLRQSINTMSYTSTFLLYLFGGLLAIRGSATIGTLVAFGYYLNYLYGPLGDLSDRFSTLQNALSSMKKIDQFLSENSEEPNLEEGVAIQFEGQVEFKDVSFSYDGKSKVLDNINLRVDREKKIAIVGYTGAGKSTIANIVLGFYEPTEGDVFYDGISIRKVRKVDLRSKMAIVLQNIFIFKGTVRDNITLGKDFSDDEIVKAATKIGVHDFIMRLPQGYETELVTEGKNISVGERQLISFARALVYNPELLILDEATASIDSQTEELIENGIKQLLKGRTSIVIAHRLSTIRNADQIIVINNGRIVEQGNHSQLMRKKGLYYELYTTQISRA